MTQAVVYMSLAPKSNALYRAYERAKADALEHLAEPVPLVIRNAPTRLMRELDYGKGYQYAHDTADKLTNMQCLPRHAGWARILCPYRARCRGQIQGAPGKDQGLEGQA